MSKEMQVIERDGKPEYAVIPYEEYLRLRDVTEMASDVAAYDRAMKDMEGKEWVPSEVIDRLIDGEHPVKVWREHRKMKQGELAEKLGKSGAYLSHIESWKRDGTIKLYSNLARALQVDIDDLVVWQERNSDRT